MKVNLLEPSYVIRLFHTRYFDARKLNSIFIFCGIHCVDFLPNKYNQIVVSMKYNIERVVDPLPLMTYGLKLSLKA